MNQKVIEFRQLLQILSMFMIVQFFGILLATQAYSGIEFYQIQSVQLVSNTESALFYIVYIVVLTAILLLVFKIYKGDKLFLLLEAGVVLISSFFVFLIIIASFTGSVAYNLYGPGNPYVMIAALILSIVLVATKLKIPRLRNVTAIIASVGVGVILGISFSFEIAFIFMVVLAIYDFIAVFITKHMITLGNAAISRNLSFLVMVDEYKAVPVNSLNISERKEFAKEKHELAKKGGVLKELADKNMAPIAARTALGTGDLAVPLMLAISAYKVYFNFVLSFVIIFGAILGLGITMFILAKFKRPLPAIPPLLLGICIALLIYYVL
ncbi:MAG: presenilin family intramembrane aspartyl protease [Candidatus Micrarchaeia archaeon]